MTKLTNEQFRDMHRFFENPPDLFLMLLAAVEQRTPVERIKYIIKLLGVEPDFTVPAYLRSTNKRHLLNYLMSDWGNAKVVKTLFKPLTDGTPVCAGFSFDMLREITFLTPKTEAVLVGLLEANLQDVEIHTLEIGMIAVGLAYRVQVNTLPIEELTC